MTVRPDIILVMTDQQRADSLGYAGNRFVATPHIDALAASSLRFRNAVTPFPLCSPARAGLWTGLHAHRHGITDNIYGEPDALARLGRATVFPAMQAAGYRTAYIGKWHLGRGSRPGSITGPATTRPFPNGSPGPAAASGGPSRRPTRRSGFWPSGERAVRSCWSCPTIRRIRPMMRPTATSRAIAAAGCRMRPTMRRSTASTPASGG